MPIKLDLFAFFLFINLAQPQNLRLGTISNASNLSSFQSSPTFSQRTNVLQSNSPNVLSSNSISELIGDVQLSHHIPPTFIVGEIFQFFGNVNATKLSIYLRSKNSIKKVYELNILLTNRQTGQKTICSKNMKATQTAFIHQCLFSSPGQFYISIVIGDRNQVTPKIYKVINAGEIPQKPILKSAVPAKPKYLNLTVQANDLYINWDQSAKLTKIVFQQRFPSLNRKQFVISNDRGLFKVPYSEFKNFSKVLTQIQISHADSNDLCASERNTEFSQPQIIEINVTDHLFQEIRYPQVELSKDIKSMVNINEDIEIQGTSFDEVDEIAIVVDPQNRIQEKQMEINKASRSHKFKLRQRMRDQGVYIVEINHAEGYALVNTPIYAGSSYPLLPDFMDLYPQKNNKEQKNMSLSEMRQFVLNLINKKRRQAGVSEVFLDQQLNSLAQKHADEMAINSYASHTNLKGESSGDRAKRQGINSPVGENIVVNKDLQYARYQLDRSPNHLKNTIRGTWDRVGVGIHKKYNGYYYITEQYSCEDLTKNPVTPTVISQIKSSIVQKLNTKAPIKIIQNLSFSSELQQWFDNHPDFLSNIQSLKKLIMKKKMSTVQFVRFKAPYILTFLEEVQKHGYFDYRGLKQLGIALNISDNTLEAFMIFYS